MLFFLGVGLGTCSRNLQLCHDAGARAYARTNTQTHTNKDAHTHTHTARVSHAPWPSTHPSAHLSDPPPTDSQQLSLPHLPPHQQRGHSQHQSPGQESRTPCSSSPLRLTADSARMSSSSMPASGTLIVPDPRSFFLRAASAAFAACEPAHASQRKDEPIK